MYIKTTQLAGCRDIIIVLLNFFLLVFLVPLTATVKSFIFLESTSLKQATENPSKLGALLICFNQAAYCCSHYFLCTYLHLIEPQSLRVEGAAYMFNQAAYSCNHHFLWSHLHIMKPQSLQFRSSVNMLNQAAYSCTHHLLYSHLHIVKPQSLLVRSLVEMLY